MKSLLKLIKTFRQKFKRIFRREPSHRKNDPKKEISSNKGEYKIGLTSIVILTYNQLEYTKLCLKSIREYTDEATYEIIVVDNHSTDGTVQWLQEQEDIKVILNDENLGFPKGCNQGIKIANGDSILLLNNDTIVTRNWLINLRKCLFSHEKIGAVGPVTNVCGHYQRIQIPYRTIDEMHIFAEQYNIISNPVKWDESIMLVGFCLLIKREAVERIGLLDERFTPGNYEDNDYCFRMKKSGYSLKICKDTFIHHFGNVSFNEAPSMFADVLIVNREKFRDKWGFAPMYYQHIRLHLLGFIKDPMEKQLKVLDVGCGLGTTLLELKNRYRNAKIYGIELNKAVGEIAGTHADVIIGNIEKINLNFPGDYFDYIILGDILEHLEKPDEVLIKLKKHLRKEGEMLISIPNVMHNSVIKDLLYGNWTYKDAGILDRTHLRFFTYRESIKMFEQASLKTVDCVTVRAEGDKEFVKKLVGITDPSYEWEYYTYQYLFKVKKNT
ncbi:bifunctional glycosyltransferase family 2 protein/class I SAM-dependent methyltransferase [Wukongibacter baidiensis]|uniref:glycosyltransferase n=1 Tax=Wukongibacter baidiensis TaxID=1723361 RepID=UPI003D7F8EBF